MSLPLDHLSASSLAKFMRCPRQWQDKYILGKVEPSNSSLVIGSAVHEQLSALFKGLPLDPAGIWHDEVEEAGEVIWKDSEDKSYELFVSHVYHYWERMGKHLGQVEHSEQEIAIEIAGIDIPIIGFVDLEIADRIIDFKTTAYFNSKQVRPNKEWKFQMAVYQLAIEKPAEVHVLTRSKTDPVVVPESTKSPLYFGVADREKTRQLIRDTYDLMTYYYDIYGSVIAFPGNPMHDWASKYCNVEECCAL